MRMYWLLILLGAFLLCPQARAADPEPRDISVAGRNSVEVPLDEGGNGLWVEAWINGRVKTKLLVDTGSSVVILPAQLAEEIGLRVNEGQIRKLSTVQGTVTGRLVTLEYIELGSARAEGVTAVVLEEGSDDGVGLLGRSFLKHFAFGFDLDKGVMTLIPRNTSQASILSPEQAEIEENLRRLRSEQARAYTDESASPEYLQVLQRSVERLESSRSSYN